MASAEEVRAVAKEVIGEAAKDFEQMCKEAMRYDLETRTIASDSLRTLAGMILAMCERLEVP